MEGTKIIQGRGIGVDEPGLQAAIIRGEKECTQGGQTITPGATCLLVIGLDGGRDVVVNHCSNVRLVNSHTKGVGGDDDGQAITHEGILHAIADVRAKAGVIGISTQANHVADESGYIFSRTARGNVDNDAASLYLLLALVRGRGRIEGQFQEQLAQGAQFGVVGGCVVHFKG